MSLAIRAPSGCQDELGLKSSGNPIFWSLRVAERTQERSAPTQLHERAQLQAPHFLTQ